MTKDQQPSQGDVDLAMINACHAALEESRRYDPPLLPPCKEIWAAEIIYRTMSAALHSTSEGRVEQMREALGEARPFVEACEDRFHVADTLAKIDAALGGSNE
jgi:ribosomal protein S7